MPKTYRPEFSVININLWRGGTSAVDSYGKKVGAKAALSAVAGFIKRQLDGGIGVVGLQEVHKDVKPTGVDNGNVDQSVVLASDLGSGWTPVFGQTRTAGNVGGVRGNAVLSNVTVEKSQVWKFVHDPQNRADYGRFPRGATAVKLAFPGNRKLWMVATHFDGGDSRAEHADVDGQVAIRQLFQLLGNVKTFDPDFPAIVTGDFNIKESGRGKTPAAFTALDAIMDESTSGFRRLVHKRRVYMYLYDPHERLQVLDTVSEEARGDAIQFSDHEVLTARFAWRSLRSEQGGR